jgi:RNA polymerase sigma-70 factor (ECF subfamily)
MLQVKEGDVSRLAGLFERHHARIYHFCYRMTGNQATSQDLVQEIFMRILKYRHTFRDDSAFLPWMYRMARNACVDHFRRRGRSPIATDNLPDVPSDRPSAVERLEVDEDVSRLRCALLRLPVDKREVLILSRYELRRHSEIADLLNCSVGAVKVRVHRALKQLREIYLELSSEAAS